MKFQSICALIELLLVQSALSLPTNKVQSTGIDIDSIKNHPALSESATEATLDAFHTPEPWEVSKRQEEKCSLIDPASADPIAKRFCQVKRGENSAVINKRQEEKCSLIDPADPIAKRFCQVKRQEEKCSLIDPATADSISKRFCQVKRGEDSATINKRQEEKCSLIDPADPIAKRFCQRKRQEEKCSLIDPATADPVAKRFCQVKRGENSATINKRQEEKCSLIDPANAVAKRFCQ